MGKQSKEYNETTDKAFKRNEELEREYKYRVILDNRYTKVRKFFDDYDEAYTYLMKLRFLHILETVEEEEVPNNDNCIMLIKNNESEPMGGEALIRFGIIYDLETFKQKIKDKEL